MGKVFGSMTAQGYIKDPKTMLDEIFSLSLLAYDHQSSIYYGNVTSFDKYMKEYNNRPNELAEVLTKKYTEYFLRHYPKVSGSVTANEPKDETFVWSLTIAFVVTDYNGIKYQLNEIINYKDSKIERVTSKMGGLNERI